jgi:hypothetical protein
MQKPGRDEGIERLLRFAERAEPGGRFRDRVAFGSKAATMISRA